MHPLRFFNSGIGTKAVGRRGGQPRPAAMQGRPPTARPRPRPTHRGGACGHGELRPARKGSNRPQLDTCKGAGYRAMHASGGYHEGSEKEGRPATANPHAWPATHGQGQPIGAALAGMASCGQPARAATARSSTLAKGQATGRCAQVAATSGQEARGGFP
ncbi:hypothetical protein B296_00033083 [Ensete ventricosum]|uniref:Uncharacterized protein n=1 Tax=Ensete ventricosum TaxID=4639 RepID=A0A426XID0_ENSVE|nr:hypothetical protein B296_00033083 [Ensete ventricosum]